MTTTGYYSIYIVHYTPCGQKLWNRSYCFFSAFILAETRRKTSVLLFVDNSRFINDVCRTYCSVLAQIFLELTPLVESGFFCRSRLIHSFSTQQRTTVVIDFKLAGSSALKSTSFEKIGLSGPLLRGPGQHYLCHLTVTLIQIVNESICDT